MCIYSLTIKYICLFIMTPCLLLNKINLHILKRIKGKKAVNIPHGNHSIGSSVG